MLDGEDMPLQVDAVYGLFDDVEQGIRYARDRKWPDWECVVLTEV